MSDGMMINPASLLNQEMFEGNVIISKEEVVDFKDIYAKQLKDLELPKKNEMPLMNLKTVNDSLEDYDLSVDEEEENVQKLADIEKSINEETSQKNEENKAFNEDEREEVVLPNIYINTNLFENAEIKPQFSNISVGSDLLESKEQKDTIDSKIEIGFSTDSEFELENEGIQLKNLEVNNLNEEKLPINEKLTNIEQLVQTDKNSKEINVPSFSSNVIYQEEFTEKSDTFDKKEEIATVDKLEEISNELLEIKNEETKQPEASQFLNSSLRIESQIVTEHEDIASSEQVQSFEEANFSSIVNRITDEVESLTPFESREFKLTLQPENLGEMDIILKMKDGKVTAEFLVESTGVKEIMEKSIPLLQENLVNQNIVVEKGKITVHIGNQTSFDFSGDLNQRQRNQQKNVKSNKLSQQYEGKEEFHEVATKTAVDAVDILV